MCKVTYPWDDLPWSRPLPWPVSPVPVVREAVAPHGVVSGPPGIIEGAIAPAGRDESHFFELEIGLDGSVQERRLKESELSDMSSPSLNSLCAC